MRIKTQLGFKEKSNRVKKKSLPPRFELLLLVRCTFPLEEYSADVTPRKEGSESDLYIKASAIRSPKARCD
jgi:hypothetical protein